MTPSRAMLLLAALLLTLCGALRLPAQEPASGEEPAAIQIIPLNEQGWAEYHPGTHEAVGTNGVMIQYKGAVLTADSVRVKEETGEVTADGHVRIQQGAQVWVSEHLTYNFNTKQMRAAQFRTGQAPIFASGEGLRADTTNHVYYATNALLTTDDVAKPGVKVRAKYIKIIPNKRMEARNAVLYAGDVPIFYFPFYSRNLGPNANNFNFTPGYRSLYGPFVLGNYTWYLNEELDGKLHFDYRQKRGPGGGPEFNYHLGPWGDGTFLYYYTYDKDPTIDNLGVPIPNDRQRLYFSYIANPVTNVDLRALVRYESDLAVERDFFERAFREDPQPSTFVEGEKFWNNFGLDAYVQPQVNSFLQTVERLPDIRLTGYRQEIGETPLYYESESSAGYYRQAFAQTNGLPPAGLDYEAARADTYHQVLLPETFFGWLNFTPRVGGRFTYYSEASGPGATTDEQYRGVFNTGTEVSFKASRLWSGVQNDAFEVDGVRHIIEPSANYVFVPSPSTPPGQLPQFDTVLPSLRLLPIEYPDFNAIDAIDTQNVIRYGLRNRLQTKRQGKIVNLVDWNLYTDWRLDPQPGQTTFSDLFSDLTVRPRSWLSLESLTRYSLDTGEFNMAYNTLSIRPNDVWSWSLGYYYLRDNFAPDPTAWGIGNNVFTSTMTYRMNENWAFRMSHYFDAQTGQLQEHSYTLYRDLRSWTAAMTLLFRNPNAGAPEDFTVAFTFSFKAYPSYKVGADAGGPVSLLGGS